MNLKKLFLLFLDKRELKNIEILSLKNIKSILIRPLGGAIGDAVVHTAHLKQLRYLYPNARIGVIVNPHNRVIFEHSNLVDEYLSLISSADLVIAVDGGSLHIACAFKKPLLSFFAKSQPNMGTWEPLVYPDVPHLKVLTYDDVGSNSNLTKNFDMTTAYEWLKKQLENRVGN